MTTMLLLSSHLWESNNSIGGHLDRFRCFPGEVFFPPPLFSLVLVILRQIGASLSQFCRPPSTRGEAADDGPPESLASARPRRPIVHISRSGWSLDGATPAVLRSPPCLRFAAEKRKGPFGASAVLSEEPQLLAGTAAAALSI